MSVGDPEVAAATAPLLEWLNVLDGRLHQARDVASFEAFLEALSEHFQQLSPYACYYLVLELSLGTTEAEESRLKDLFDYVHDNPHIFAGLVRLVESYWTQTRIRAMLRDRGYGDDVFCGYLQCLQLYADDAQHDAIMSRVWSFFTASVDDQTLIQLRIAFLEEHVAQSLGIDFQTMARMEDATGDRALYLDVLTYLDHSQKNNIAWYMIVDMIRSVVLRRRPEVWNELATILSDWRASYVEPFLAKARDMITDDEAFAQFSSSYAADPANAFDSIDDTHFYDADDSDDNVVDGDGNNEGGLVESLKRLQITAVPARPQGPRRAVNR
ncbi:hypothetical protein BDZ88DRAFT_439481 [Geranomyces variabilis]|nr:hypothetical protein BDZ88DRAFT_439481 [Geranomyces variabilis]KAJ3135170.1 hypothetical protein HDU90_004202 [Geranomyces variabilis]